MKRGRIFEIDGEHWVATHAHRTRMTLHLAESEWHAIRLSLGLTQQQMAQRLGVSQSYLCKIEKGVCEAPETLAKQLRAMRPAQVNTPKYCVDPDNCTYSDCPTAFCDRFKP